MDSIWDWNFGINSHPAPFPIKRDPRINHSMTTNSDLPTAAIDHVSSMLTLAKQKHEEAMAMVGVPDANAIPRLRQVLELLDEVELLAEDAGSYVENDAMLVAMNEIRQQQASIKLAIKRLEKLSKRSPWVSPWPWIVLLVLLVVVIVSLATPSPP